MVQSQGNVWLVMIISITNCKCLVGIVPGKCMAIVVVIIITLYKAVNVYCLYSTHMPTEGQRDGVSRKCKEENNGVSNKQHFREEYWLHHNIYCELYRRCHWIFQLSLLEWQNILWKHKISITIWKSYRF